MTQASAPVLLVDSNRDGLDLYSTALALEGIDTATASTVGEALDRVAADQPRVLVTELRLPGTGGMGLIRQLRTHVPRSKLFIVALTSNEHLDSAGAREAGCDVVLRVPCLPETLVGAVRCLLD